MKFNIYTIKDTKIGYMQPFYLQNDAIAIREFAHAVNEKKENSINRDLEDKELWKIGKFNDETGEIESELEFLRTAIALKKFNFEPLEVIDETI